jgi:hypothetical protein
MMHLDMIKISNLVNVSNLKMTKTIMVFLMTTRT